MQEVLERIQQNGRHLLGLINDVLDLSKIEAGQLTLSPVDYSLRELVLDVVSATEALAAEKRLALEVDAAPDLPHGKGDERRLTQVLMNLVSNAIKFTEAGSVSIRAKVADGSFLVTVTDTGIGIAPEDRERVFEEFQQVELVQHAQEGRHRPRPRDRAPHRRAARRPHLGRIDPRPGLDLRLHAAARRREAGGRSMMGGDRMRRRDVALGLAGFASLSALPLGRLRAQQPSRLPKVAFLLPDAPDDLRDSHRHTADTNVLEALAELGYVDGQNVTFEFGFANHELERLPALAAELVAGQPDVLYTYTSGGARAAAGATTTIPIVVAPVAVETMAALVPDFARPPGNITGLTLTSREQREKCLQLLKEAVPGITRVGVLFNPLNPIWRGYPEVMDDTARGLGIDLVKVEAHGDCGGGSGICGNGGSGYGRGVTL